MKLKNKRLSAPTMTYLLIHDAALAKNYTWYNSNIFKHQDKDKHYNITLGKVKTKSYG